MLKWNKIIKYRYPEYIMMSFYSITGLLFWLSLLKFGERLNNKYNNFITQLEENIIAMK